MRRQNPYLLPFILVTSLFFLWAFLHNINPVLIPHLKKAFVLSDTSSALIDSAVYLAYFIMALPAGWFMHRYGYKKGILCGLLLYGAGALVFLPAAEMRSYALFLAGLFIIASGATFLETVANPYITQLGDESTATQRLNFAQSFNGVGAFLAPIIGGTFILSGVEYSEAELQRLAATGGLDAYLQSEADAIKLPYAVMAGLVLLLAALFFFTRLPEQRETEGHARFSFSVLRNPQVAWAVIAQFFYIGAQVCVGSFFIRFSRSVAGLPEVTASYWWGVAAMGFMIGRFAGTALMRFVRPERLLALYGSLGAALVGAAVFVPGMGAVYLLLAVPFFMSIMFPTIFALGIRGLGAESKIASSFIVMSIVGGAFFPLLMGWISDASGGNIQLSYLVPAACFVVVVLFALRQRGLVPTEEPLALTH